MKKFLVFFLFFLIIPFIAIAQESIVLGLNWGDSEDTVKRLLNKRFNFVTTENITDGIDPFIEISSKTEIEGFEYRIYCTIRQNKLQHINIICNVDLENKNNPYIANDLAEKFFSNYLDSNSNYKLVRENLHKTSGSTRDYISKTTHVSVAGGGGPLLEGAGLIYVYFEPIQNYYDSYFFE